MIAINQAYYLPYLGYFQLINYVDFFVLYNDTKFQKTGWAVQNFFLDSLLTINIRKRNKEGFVYEKRIHTENFMIKIKKMRTQASNLKYFDGKIFDQLFKIPENENYFEFLHNQILTICKLLSINTKILVSSNVCDTKNLSGKLKIFKICKQLKQNHYINFVAGKKLYNQNDFQKENIKLSFFEHTPFIDNNGVEDLDSILKLLFYYKLTDIKKFL